MNIEMDKETFINKRNKLRGAYKTMWNFGLLVLLNEMDDLILFRCLELVVPFAKLLYLKPRVNFLCFKILTE